MSDWGAAAGALVTCLPWRGSAADLELLKGVPQSFSLSRVLAVLGALCCFSREVALEAAWQILASRLCLEPNSARLLCSSCFSASVPMSDPGCVLVGLIFMSCVLCVFCFCIGS